jgi:hypothetical protein
MSKKRSDKFFERNEQWKESKQKVSAKKKQELSRSKSKELTFKPDITKSRQVSPMTLKKTIVSDMKAVDKFLGRMK